MQDIEAVALGVLQISILEVGFWSVAEITAAMHWRGKYRTDELELMYRASWEQTRLIAAYVISPYSKEKIRDVTTFFPFPWDKSKQKTTPADLEKTAEILRKLDEMQKREHGK